MLPLAQGDVLEIGVGPGVNFVHYDPAKVVKLYALEPNPGMIRMAEQQRRKTELSIEFVDLPGERLPLEDNTVDTVVSTFTLCTIPGVSQAIQGIRRVLRPEGKFIDCRPDGRRNDYVNNSCPDSGSSFLRVDEGTGLATRNVASETTNLGHRVNLQIAIGGCRGEDRLICLQHE